jgi:hypothetical protein
MTLKSFNDECIEKYGEEYTRYCNQNRYNPDDKEIRKQYLAQKAAEYNQKIEQLG